LLRRPAPINDGAGLFRHCQLCKDKKMKRREPRGGKAISSRFIFKSKMSFSGYACGRPENL
jgi:hypothetical protein